LLLFLIRSLRYLHIAVIHGQEEVVVVLLERTPHPLLLDIQNDYAQTALHIAVATSQPNIVRKLIIAGAKVRQ
jgi:ankyrin repeat protein